MNSRIAFISLCLAFLLAIVMGNRDFYKILGIKRNATPAQIKKAYRTMSFKFHPDKNKDDPNAKSKFQDVASGRDTN